MRDIIIFGDSITYGAWDDRGGWAARLREWVDAKNHATGQYSMVYNLGIPGDTIVDVLSRFQGELSARIERPSDTLVLVAVGTNDSYIRDGNERVPFDVYNTKLALCVRHLKQLGVHPLLVGLVGCDESKTNPVSWGTHIYLNSRLSQYNQGMKAVAASEGVGFVDLWSHCSGNSWNAMLYDGIHPNSQGHEKMFNTIIDSLITQKLV